MRSPQRLWRCSVQYIQKVADTSEDDEVATSSFIIVHVPRKEFLWCCWCTIECLLKRFQRKELQCQLQHQNMCWLSRPTLLQRWQISRIHSCCCYNSKLTGVKYFVGVYSGQFPLATKSGSGVKTRKKTCADKEKKRGFCGLCCALMLSRLRNGYISSPECDCCGCSTWWPGYKASQKSFCPSICPCKEDPLANQI